MGKVKLFIFLVLALAGYVYFSRPYWFFLPVASVMQADKAVYTETPRKVLSEGMLLLKQRRDNEAWTKFLKVLMDTPHDSDALWGKAEILRRVRKYEEAQALLQEVLAANPKHVPALISLAYMKLERGQLNEAQRLVGEIFKDTTEKENHALAYMIMGAINAKRAELGNILNKVKYATQIKCYFTRAKELAPQLAEVRLALGVFYLTAPPLLGGNINKALAELKSAVELAPDFATANARLAQCYLKKGDQVNYNYYLDRAEALDPDNEVLPLIRRGPPGNE